LNGKLEALLSERYGGGKRAGTYTTTGKRSVGFSGPGKRSDLEGKKNANWQF